VQSTNNDLISLVEDLNVTDVDVDFNPLAELNQGMYINTRIYVYLYACIYIYLHVNTCK
jgi:hypothetical protein